MTRRTAPGLFLLALLALSGPAGAVPAPQPHNTATGRATARIVEPPLCARPLYPLVFGGLSAGPHGGKATIDARTNQRILSGQVYPLLPFWYTRAGFSVQGEHGRHYSVVLPTSLTVPKYGIWGPPLLVNNFRAYSNNLHAFGPAGLLNGGGQDLLYVGGDLLLQPGSFGYYVAPFNVTVAYQ